MPKPDQMERCSFCGVTIRKINTWNGDLWIHVLPGISETNQYQHCKLTVATPRMPVQAETLL